MNEIKLEAKLHEEDRVRIDALIRELRYLSGVITGTAGGAGPQTAETEPVKEMDQPAEKTPQSEPQSAVQGDNEPQAPQTGTPERAAPVQTVDLAEVQRKVVELSAAGHKEKVRDIVKSYAERVSAIPEDKLAEVMSRLTALEG